ncbi:MAG: hypothetical protein ABMB14_35285 [Myxococcota bacterium]
MVRALAAPSALLLGLVSGAASCAGPGTMWSPQGTTALRTALYRVAVRDGAPELVIALSNGELDCALPTSTDTADQAEAIEALLAAACREGAQHLALHAYDVDEAWTGTFVGRTGAEASELGPLAPRLARAAYYTVEEAFLIEIDGLARGYAASEDLYLPDFGNDGLLDLDGPDDDGRLRGAFTFPDEALSGRFRAERCDGDTSLLDVIAAQPVHFCQ